MIFDFRDLDKGGKMIVLNLTLPLHYKISFGVIEGGKSDEYSDQF